ncbi:HAD family phosphatase [Bacillus sp. HMF5848]|uniref:Cof-type HAD-IIB family hydrolase n=1 Tax=Bacillus sp. HMF5848 TaxID=2495421 RepID=UPI000F7B5C32|nr:Cof-type HAD-IIB family hydrolase [Bacillus sp. HMF5848]RSK26294.1 HAD family phosphatase [Bacillus sp. HMF5848]
MLYKLLAINIDGTLLKPNGRLQRDTKEAIDFALSKEVYVTLVTGRSFLSAKKVAKALKLESHLVTHDGAFIGDSIDEPLQVKRLSEEMTFNIVQVLETFECNIRIQHERFSISNKKRLPGSLLGKVVLSSGDPLFYPLQFVDSLGDSLRDKPVEAPKLEVYFSDKQEREHAMTAIANAFPEVDVITKETHNAFVIVPRGVSKLGGLKALGKHLNIEVNKMVVIGDESDDIPMLEAAGLGVAMGQAKPDVKKAADWITRSNNQLGVAYMIREHFRKQQRFEFLNKIKVD